MGERPKLAKRLRKCPRCGKRHRWPTEDKLCRKCEGEWVEEYENDPAYLAALGAAK